MSNLVKPIGYSTLLTGLAGVGKANEIDEKYRDKNFGTLRCKNEDIIEKDLNNYLKKKYNKKK